jgi:hypothetical protein
VIVDASGAKTPNAVLELSLIAHDLIAWIQRLEGELAICEPERFGTAGSDYLPGSS